MKRNAVYPLALIAAAAAVMVTGTSLRASEADDEIQASFKDSYVYKTYLKDDSIKTEVKDGVVTLTGTVAVESHKALAEDTAANVFGVTRVDNRLATQAEVANVNADMWINRKVKFALFFHRNVNGSTTAVDVKDGIVTLRGVASNEAQKQLTAEYAADIEGVKEVKNEMTVAAVAEPPERTAGEKLDDASVTAQVKSALATHRSTSAVAVKADTRNGRVMLTGIARNAAEKSLVTKLVADIKGVSGVRNQMTIAEVVKR